MCSAGVEVVESIIRETWFMTLVNSYYPISLNDKSQAHFLFSSKQSEGLSSFWQDKTLRDVGSPLTQKEGVDTEVFLLLVVSEDVIQVLSCSMLG